MILIDGCSWTAGMWKPGSPEDDWGGDFHQGVAEDHWPYMLAKKLGMEYVNNSSVGKDNYEIYRQLHTYLINARAGLVEKPTIVIWQMTELFREFVPVVYHKEEESSFVPGKLDTQVGFNHISKMRKLMVWGRYFKLLESMIKSNNGEKLSELDEKLLASRFHMGTDVVQKGVNDPTYPEMRDRKRQYVIGDYTFMHNILRQLLHINTIADICKSMDIKFILYNYMGFGDEIVEKEPLFYTIDKDIFALDDPTFGMFNHLFSLGFKTFDGIHFNNDAHLYQADLLYNFITKQQKINVVKKDILDGPGFFFDYTTGLEPGHQSHPRMNMFTYNRQLLIDIVSTFHKRRKKQ